ncbi:MAG: nucleoside phosphorylase [Eudoraea sp.]|nr:nucleoside phosphorylase [Eudoraea sp.]
MQFGPSEFILNADKSIYHLKLLPEDIADTIIVVGDPDRVWEVSKYFDFIEVEKNKREFRTHTGRLNDKRITVISTGIGTDNIDIVLNELDALVNIDFESKTIKPEHTQLDIIRIGTSGAVQADIPLDAFVLSEFAIGFDNLIHFYKSEEIQHPDIQLAFIDHTAWSVFKSIPYVVRCNEELAIRLRSDRVHTGLTATNVGFYGPQGRMLRLPTEDEQMISKISSFNYEGMRITNMEMETSGIYGLAALMGHRAVSMNCILANRSTGEFSLHPEKAVDELIQYVLERLTG